MVTVVGHLTRHLPWSASLLVVSGPYRAILVPAPQALTDDQTANDLTSACVWTVGAAAECVVAMRCHEAFLWGMRPTWSRCMLASMGVVLLRTPSLLVRDGWVEA